MLGKETFAGRELVNAVGSLQLEKISKKFVGFLTSQLLNWLMQLAVGS
jgi:hypothetical protein